MNARRPIAGLILGSLLLLSPGLAAAQDNPWRVPPAAGPGYGGPTAWQGGGVAGTLREPSYAAAWPGERVPPAQCQAETRWAAADPAPGAGQRRMSDAGGLNAVAALGATAITTGSNREWRQGERPVAGYAAPTVASAPPLMLGEFPPLDGDVTRQPSPAPRGEARYVPDSYSQQGRWASAYAAPVYAPPSYEPRGRDDMTRGARREAPPSWNTYPAPPPGPSTLGGGWGGSAGGYGTGIYGSYAYPYAGGVPTTYGWY